MHGLGREMMMFVIFGRLCLDLWAEAAHVPADLLSATADPIRLAKSVVKSNGSKFYPVLKI